jgi:hypothetical protein
MSVCLVESAVDRIVVVIAIRAHRFTDLWLTSRNRGAEYAGAF